MRHLTRRHALAATAGALGAAALPRGPLLARGALAALAQPRPVVGEVPVGALEAGRSRTVALAANADLVGLSWSGPAHAGLRIRFALPSGRMGPWAVADACGHGPDALPGPAGAHTGEPVWSGGTRLVEIESGRPLRDVRLRTVDVSHGLGAARLARAVGPLAAASALALASPRLPAGGGQPPIIARRAWAGSSSRPSVAPEYGEVRVAFVHHTENPNGYTAAAVPAMLRAIWAFHRFVNGWDDIGYNFVVDLYGRVFEARAGGIDEPVVGAHAGGYNAHSTGIAVLGSFGSVRIGAGARASLQSLLAWKLSLHGMPSLGTTTVRVSRGGAVWSKYRAGTNVRLPRIAGHRDGDSTECPGDALYAQLPAVRSAVHALAGVPVRATLALGAQVLPPAPSTVGAAGAGAQEPAPAPAAPPAAGGRVLEGTLARTDGTPLSAAAVTLQARAVTRRGETVTETAIAQALTDATGRFAFAGAWAQPAAGARAAHTAAPIAVRALYAGGAVTAVSDPLWVIAPAQAPAPSA